MGVFDCFLGTKCWYKGVISSLGLISPFGANQTQLRLIEWCTHPNQMLILVRNITWPNPYIDTYTWLDTHINTPVKKLPTTPNWMLTPCKSTVQYSTVQYRSFGQLFFKHCLSLGSFGQKLWGGSKMFNRTDPPFWQHTTIQLNTVNFHVKTLPDQHHSIGVYFQLINTIR